MTQKLGIFDRHTAVIVKMAACADRTSPHMGGILLAEHLRNQEEPFQLTADPKFCYLDPARRHASARLLSGLYGGDGLFALTGRAGIGKSILVRHLSEQLNGLDVVYPLTPMQVFACRTETVLADVFGACESRLRLGESISAPLKAAKRLQQLADSAQSPVLLLDDADLLGDDVLEAIVTLSELQASDRSLLSVVLAGQSSVVARLAAIGGASIEQAERIINLEPMTDADASRLIRHRLRMAERPEDTFATEAIARILRHAGGVPVSIVRTCRRALQMAESRALKSVTADMVAEAIAEEPSGYSREPARAISSASLGKSNASAEVSLRRAGPIAAQAVPDQQFEPGSRTGPPPFPQPSLVNSTAPPGAQAGLVTPSAEPRPARPPTHADQPATPEPSLIREPHMSLPDVTLGRPIRARSGERTTRDYGGDRRRRRGSRLKFTLAGAAFFLVLLAAGFLVLMGGTRQLGDASRTSLTAGLRDDLGSQPDYQPTYQTEEDSTEWWRPTIGSDPAPSGARIESDNVAGSKEHSRLPGLGADDGGRSPGPADLGPGGNTRPRGPDPLGDDAASTSHFPPPSVSPPPAVSPAPAVSPPALKTPETVSRTGSTPAQEHHEQPPANLPAVAPKAESRPPAIKQSGTQPQPKPATQIAKPAGPQDLGPQVKQNTGQAKAAPPRSREVDNLLAEGDARLAEGDMAGARSAYEQAYDKGSTAAALRMAQTFDPRSVPGTTKTASPAEAILWYQDAARKGDRAAREELDNLAGWLENDAASGNQEARRVLDLWRQPAESESEEPY